MIRKSLKVNSQNKTWFFSKLLTKLKRKPLQFYVASILFLLEDAGNF